MVRWLSILVVALGAFGLTACSESGNPLGAGGAGGNGGGVGGTPRSCDEAPLPSCGDSCSSTTDCGAGTYCGGTGTCTFQCTQGLECGDDNPDCNIDCNEDFECTSTGRCRQIFTGSGGTGNQGGENECQSVEVTPTRSIPNVMFLVDQSGSMTSGFSMGQDRWQAARNAITTVVGEKESIVRFGLTTYTSDDGNDPCPLLPVAGNPQAASPRVDFALNASAAISDTTTYPTNYPSDAGDETPTGDSLDLLVSIIEGSPPPAEGPTIVVLATDGEPDSCEQPNPNPTDQAREEAVDAAAAAHAAGIDVFVLWVGDLDDNPSDPTRSHMQDVADAGVEGTGTVYVGDDPVSLSNAFETIISDSISCDIEIDKPFADVDEACEEGDVQLNGVSLACPSEWRVKPGEANVIELVGSACDTFKAEASTFTAVFTCGAIVVE